MQATETPIRVIQLTDPHLFATAEGRLLGMKTRDSFNACLSQALENHGLPDFFLATGDISQDHKAESYQYFLEQMRSKAPTYWLAGNHDDWPLMQQLAQGTEAAHSVIDQGSWRIIMLNSSVPKRVHGRISDAEFVLLRQALDCSASHILVCCHHHPVNMGADWLDQIGIENGQQLLACLEADTRVKMLLWGHVHQAFDQQQQGIHLACTPSTCIQFLPKSPGFALDELGPGWRYLELYADGSIHTEVRRLPASLFDLDTQATGY